MRLPRGAFASLLGLWIGAAAGSGAAVAQEELLMPFACDARGGGVRLVPAPQQSYRIYGPHEQKLFRHCSPDTPDRCRNWMLHRFEVDCDGVTVPWIRVAEAAAQRGRAWVQDGRMSLQMGPVWASPREERRGWRRWWMPRPHPRFDEEYGDRGQFDRPVGSPRDVVELPPGFAPVLGTRAQFIGNAPEVSSAPVERGSEPAGTTAERPSSATTKKSSGEPSAAPKEPAAKTIKPPAPQPAKREGEIADAATPAQKAVAPAEKPPAAQVKPAAAPQKVAKAETPAPKPEATGGASVTPTIINKPQGASAPPAQAAAPSATVEPTASDQVHIAPDAAASQESADASSTTGENTDSQTRVADSSAAVAQATDASPIATGSLRDTGAPAGETHALPTRALAIGFTLFGVLAASSLVLWSRRREQARIGSAIRRDIASVSFGGAPASQMPATIAPRLAPAQPETQVLLGNAGSEMPTTADEALRVLGASPDATLEVVKKIVDGLRQSWHPDFAKSEDDRRLREDRIKQINVAWDILSGRRTAT